MALSQAKPPCTLRPMKVKLKGHNHRQLVHSLSCNGPCSVLDLVLNSSPHSNLSACSYSLPYLQFHFPVISTPMHDISAFLYCDPHPNFPRHSQQ